MGDICITSLVVISTTINQFQFNVSPMALYCLRLFVVVYKYLHTVVFYQGGEIYMLTNFCSQNFYTF